MARTVTKMGAFPHGAGRLTARDRPGRGLAAGPMAGGGGAGGEGHQGRVGGPGSAVDELARGVSHCFRCRGGRAGGVGERP
jgi:hypothetical protein